MLFYYPGTKNKQPHILNIEILPVTRDTECGFCYARLEEIQDPRALPCGHTQCYDCIEVNYQDKEIECKICKYAAPYSKDRSIFKKEICQMKLCIQNRRA